jgi:hypothetical protein
MATGDDDQRDEEGRIYGSFIDQREVVAATRDSISMASSVLLNFLVLSVVVIATYLLDQLQMHLYPPGRKRPFDLQITVFIAGLAGIGSMLAFMIYDLIVRVIVLYRRLKILK